MSKLQELNALDAELARINALRERLLTSSELKAEVEFQGKVKALLAEYGKSYKDVLKIFGSEATAPGKRAERQVKVFKNPHTGEVVETRGGNHKTLKEWKGKWGAEAVNGWLQA